VSARNVLFSVPPPPNHAGTEIMFKNRIDPERPQMTVKYGAEKKLFACGITKARAETHRNTVFHIYCC
jgi:hypothetical protein